MTLADVICLIVIAAMFVAGFDRHDRWAGRLATVFFVAFFLVPRSVDHAHGIRILLCIGWMLAIMADAVMTNSIKVSFPRRRKTRA